MSAGCKLLLRVLFIVSPMNRFILSREEISKLISQMLITAEVLEKGFNKLYYSVTH